MAKKKAASKKKSIAKPSRRATAGSKTARLASKKALMRSGPQPLAARIYAYRHEVASNPDNAPLIADIPIAAGRGEHPRRPSFVAFTAEMAEEHWPDQFAFRIIALESTTVRVMISRIDKGSQDLGWGAKLVVHVLVIADASR